ncbi:hypothetical protein CRG98_017990 [Punica granatum]|uniref:Uncharacterized protein n=1 Tax=Punica granatum TaxID=22663 RepID=A0A2I0JZ67_PUNGR|nr:hypothetical protein CRG98_017990 [Punica granatum]
MSKLEHSWSRFAQGIDHHGSTNCNAKIVNRFIETLEYIVSVWMKVLEGFPLPFLPGMQTSSHERRIKLGSKLSTSFPFEPAMGFAPLWAVGGVGSESGCWVVDVFCVVCYGDPLFMFHVCRSLGIIAFGGGGLKSNGLMRRVKGMVS